MKGLVVVLLSVMCVYANPATTITKSCDESYNEKFCGEDYHCRASRCFYKNLSSIEEAFRFYINEAIQAYESSDEPKSQNIYWLVYEYMLNTPLPKVNESSKYTANLSENARVCEFEFKHTKDRLIIEFNACQEEDDSITFIQRPDYIEILSTTVAM